jgi:hypothetical protein
MQAIAIRKGQFRVAPPAGYQTMGTVRCDGCGEEFLLWHHLPSASPASAEKQAHWLERALAYDHEQSQRHPDRIELPE